MKLMFFYQNLYGKFAWASKIPTIFVVFSGLVASCSVLINDFYFFWQHSFAYINIYYFCFAFLLACWGRTWGLSVFIFFLPLSLGFGSQLNIIFDTNLLVLPNTGLDLSAGFYFGLILRMLLDKSFGIQKRDWSISPKNLVTPWPVALVLLLVTVSVATAIVRNLFQMASATSIKGLIFNLAHFRPIDWVDAYMPISDWVAYSLAAAMVMVVISRLQFSSNQNEVIFRPIILGLIIAAAIGIIQSLTGIGLQDATINFRKDNLGYAAVGLQSDIHSFASHMMLGAIGLWSYIKVEKSKFWRNISYLAVSLSVVGLILSKSRASLILTLIAAVILLFIFLWREKRKYFLSLSFVISASLLIFLGLISFYWEIFVSTQILPWIGDLVQNLKSRNLSSVSELGGILGSRLEVWTAAWRMYWQFPLAGIGQGNFYHLSSINFFSKSHFLILNGGENAHNYFLQTLAETGAVGAVIFMWALFSPYLNISHQKKIEPAKLALLSLFLGNLFAHSFLVRENLILAAIILGLLYIQDGDRGNYSPDKTSKAIKKTHRSIWVICIVFFTALYAIEIYYSFGKSPFIHGIYCFKDQGITGDGWIKGNYVYQLPKGSRSVELTVEAAPNKNGSELTNFTIDLRHTRRNIYGYNDVVDSMRESFKLQDKAQVNVILPDVMATNKADLLEMEIKLDKCYSPRNLGHSVDSRLLGMKIISIKSN